MVKKVQMYAKKVAMRYDPHSNPAWGSSPPTALSKVGKYAQNSRLSNTDFTRFI